MKKIKRKKYEYDKKLLFAMILACIVGLLAITSATLSFGTYQNTIVQTGAFFVGLVGVFLAIKIDYNEYSRFSKYIYIFCIFLLVLVLVIGKSGDWGAQSWIRIGPVGIQPSEIAKIGFIITFSKHLGACASDINNPKTLIKLVLHLGVYVGLIMLQPDAGSAMVFMFMFIVLIFVSGINYKYILSCLGAGLASLPIIYFFLLSPYQQHRIKVFLNPELDKLGSGYNVIQSKIAVGSGEFFGKGYLNGTQNQLGILPTKHTDFIFSTIAEEWGFVGAVFVVALLFYIILRCIKASQNSTDAYGKYVALGVSAMLIFHTFENVGMCIGLMPVTGIPLPFISYGGTSLLTNMVSVGVVLSITKRKI